MPLDSTHHEPLSRPTAVHNFVLLSLSALVTTVKLHSAIAAPATRGDSHDPITG